MHKGRNRGLAAGADVSFGSFGLKALAVVVRLPVRSKQHVAMTRAVKRQGKIPDPYSRTNRSLKSRWQCVWVKVKVTWSIAALIQPGKVLYEMDVCATGRAGP